LVVVGKTEAIGDAGQVVWPRIGMFANVKTINENIFCTFLQSLASKQTDGINYFFIC
jgi:hypothetical protein